MVCKTIQNMMSESSHEVQQGPVIKKNKASAYM